MSATEDDPTEHADSRKRGYIDSQLTWNMYFYGRELCFFLAIIFTSYAALQNAPPKVSKILPAIPFFPRDSLVADFYQGELSPTFEKISQSDLSFVMYYAPWDAESQTVKVQFDKLATYYKDQVFFAAVNCWHPTGECRRHFAKVQHFPVLIAYPALRGKGVQYRGIRKAPHMARFLQTAIRPLKRIQESDQVLPVMATHDAVVVGCVEMIRRNRFYHALYTAALTALEKDPYQEVAFAVVTNREACLKFGNPPNMPMPFLRLYLWNETLVYRGEWTGENIVRWVFGSIHQVAVWVSLPGTKALSLSPYVEEGPAVLMFTPRNPFYKHTPYFELLREVGLEYYNCNNSTWVNNVAKLIRSERLERKRRYNFSEEACFSPLLDEKCFTCRSEPSPTCATMDIVRANITTGFPAYNNNGETSKATGTCWRSKCYALQVCEKDPWNREDCIIPSMRQFLHPRLGNVTSESIDERVYQLRAELREQMCRRLLLGRDIYQAVFPRQSETDEAKLERLPGLACTNNRSLSLLALDSLEFAPLAKQLGVDLLKKPDRTAVIIFNAGESQHVLDGRVTKASLAQFLINHTDGGLPRNLRSLTTKPGACPKGSVCIKELTSSSFLPTILNDEKDVVVLYYTSYCGLCGSASLAFLNVARLFRHTRNLVFARIDGENHDLPWEYTMDLYPTIIFFPAARKAESRVFPRAKPVSTETVTQFVLANIQPESRLETLLGLHEGSPMARLHTLAAFNDVSIQRRKASRQHSKDFNPLLRWRCLMQRAQYLRLLQLALTSSPLQKEATISLQRYYALPSMSISLAKFAEIRANKEPSFSHDEL